MTRKTGNKPQKACRARPSTTSKSKASHREIDDPFSFNGNAPVIQIRETQSAYEGGKTPPFSVYHNDNRHSVKLLQGDCIEVLNMAGENRVDMIFADPPYFLSNGGITCHAGRMVSVDKGKCLR